jgi:4-hydroxy-L-threonine phosphate dehydrogenase PdxA
MGDPAGIGPEVILQAAAILPAPRDLLELVGSISKG